jgi:hypothetical protein
MDPSILNDLELSEDCSLEGNSNQWETVNRKRTKKTRETEKSQANKSNSTKKEERNENSLFTISDFGKITAIFAEGRGYTSYLMDRRERTLRSSPSARRRQVL